ncbi:MAG TPA: vWA domain-containing protein, partial [Gemmataceae bacterium]|nr:vWA domain-containing protein [Gemmataceae bacterium]
TVWADPDVAEGTISIVMDCSGSMWPPEERNGPWTRETPCKYHRATKALERVLESIPDRMKISVWLFGSKAHNKGHAYHFREPRRMLRADKLALMQDLEAEEPYGISPILQSMLDAKKELDRESGLKTLLVLTDGEDDYYDGNRQEGDSYNRFVRERVLKEFQNSGIFVSVLLFQADNDKEKQNARDQFQVLNTLEHGNGQWIDTNFRKGRLEHADEDQLVDLLKKAMLPQLRLFHGAKQVRSIAPFLDFVSPGESGREDWHGPLSPGDYQAELYQRVLHNLRLLPEDRLILRLRRHRAGDPNSGIDFTREIYGNLPQFADSRKDAKGGWLTTVMNSRLVTGAGSNFVDILFSLENTTDLGADRGILSQIRPGFTWVEVQREGDNTARPRLHWGNCSPWPAPAYDLWIPEADWSRTSTDEQFKLVPGKLTVWWDPDPFAGNVKASTVSLTPAGGHDLSQLKNAWPLSTGERVVIEEANREDHQVVVRKTRNEQPVTETKSCLALRLRYTGDEPVWVRLNNHAGGSEHRFYRQAHMATVLFWGGEVDALTRGEKPFTLSLISIGDFKRSAQQRDCMAAPTRIPIQDLAR